MFLLTVTNAIRVVAYSPYVLCNATRPIVPLIMTKFQAIIDTVLLGSMGLGSLSVVGKSNHVDSAEFYFF